MTNFNFPTKISQRSITQNHDSKTISMKSMNDLSDELREHRNFVTHKEVNNYYNLIDKNKFLPHIEDKKASSKELNAIIDIFNIRRLDTY